MTAAPEPVWPGQPRPLGATWDGEGTNFAVFAEGADAVDLALFDQTGVERRLRLPEVTAHTWHGYVPEVGPGQRYGFRVHGAYDPERGRATRPSSCSTRTPGRSRGWSTGTTRCSATRWAATTCTPTIATPARTCPGRWWSTTPSRGRRTSAPTCPGRTPSSTRPTCAGSPCATPTCRPQRGSFAAMGSDPVIAHLQRLGVTTLELLPVHHFVSEHHLVQLGLTNYWGYNSIGFFAPEARYSSTGTRGQQVSEFKAMVRNLHAAGIEVILDVVYNHTAEGNHMGPTLSFRGLDNNSYYRTVDSNRRFYMDYTGTGNTLNARHPQVLALILDSLRYWVEEMHVDGFRFDLASALARSLHEVDRLSAFFDLIHQDPVVSRVKLIAEPWDVGEGGYQVGNFRAVDRVERPLPRHHAGLLARRPHRGGRRRLPAHRVQRPVPVRRPPALCQHQLRHLPRRLHPERPGQLQRQAQRGQRRGQPGRHGGQPLLELRGRGPTDDLEVGTCASARSATGWPAAARRPVPMLTAGDELGRTQGGNSNACCQDNEISWVDWELDDGGDADRLRQGGHRPAARPPVSGGKVLPGPDHPRLRVKDIGWFPPTGTRWTRPTGGPRTCPPWGVPRRGAARPGALPAGGGRQLPAAVQRGTEPALFTLPGDLGQGVRAGRRHRPGLRPPGADAPSYLAGEELSMTCSLAVCVGEHEAAGRPAPPGARGRRVGGGGAPPTTPTTPRPAAAAGGTSASRSRSGPSRPAAGRGSSPPSARVLWAIRDRGGQDRPVKPGTPSAPTR